jgi:hypothetical protein
MKDAVIRVNNFRILITYDLRDVKVYFKNLGQIHFMLTEHPICILIWN